MGISKIVQGLRFLGSVNYMRLKLKNGNKVCISNILVDKYLATLLVKKHKILL